MIDPLFAYQEPAVAGVFEAWSHDARAVCLIAPTGAGKTNIAGHIIARHVGTGSGRVLWLTHRTDLAQQTAGRLRDWFGYNDVGEIRPGAQARNAARVQVAMVQTLRSRSLKPAADLVVLDESHHFLAEDWRWVFEAYPEARFVGPTATPERYDGTPLGDVYDAQVEVAKHSALIAAGRLVPTCVHRPLRSLGRDLAEDPLEAWLRLSGGVQTFAFFTRVDDAKRFAREARAAGIPASEIDQTTSPADRDARLRRFRRGELRILANVGTLTEGIDVPTATCALLARNYRHVGLYLQCTGRVIRAAPSKRAAVVIDLCGVSHRLGLPDEDRDWDLNKAQTVGEGEEHAAPEHGDAVPAKVVDAPMERVGVSFDVEPIARVERSREREVPGHMPTVLRGRKIDSASTGE